ncbi:hypothetical protein ACFHYQ_22215 [Sphaerimonospora cavernae]|uniref:Uncharacterized protein n=1 Tax=Sphaerimonospora cavernae TaxID=1740611 RepID=A0ABV6UA17_9ACTN
MASPRRRNEVIVGRGLSRTGLAGEPFPLCVGVGSPVRAWMELSFRFCYDPEGEYLTVLSSFIAIYGDPDGKFCLCHFDYERDKADGYPEAHIQVYGDSPVLRMRGGDLLERGLQRLHFPAGHRRFRWCLEDVVEFLVIEGIVPGKPGWQRAIEPGRSRFHEMQLKAAIRRDMTTAIGYLEEEGYQVIRSDDRVHLPRQRRP